MAHQYKVGDKVRIKEREGYESEYPCYFNDTMAQQKGKIFTIRTIRKLSPGFHDKDCKFYNGDNYCYFFEEIAYSWHSSMFEPVLEDSEIQTLTSLKIGDLVPICGMLGRILDTWDDLYYLNFNEEDCEQVHGVCCEKLKKLVPDFEKIADKYHTIKHEGTLFPEFSTIGDLVKFIQAVNNAYNSKKSITTPKTLNENEIKFQKPKAAFSRGSVPKGNPICGRKHKTAIVVGCLSNQEISC